MSDLDKSPITEPRSRLAYAASVYHVAVFLLSGYLILLTSQKMEPMSSFPDVIYALAFGAIGGALTASRYVTKAVRYGKYDPRRFLWQTLTPIHAAVLAVAGFVTINGGLIALTPGIKNPQSYSYFIMSVSFLIGLSSELFIKRLIRASESLFGESDSKTIDDLEK